MLAWSYRTGYIDASPSLGINGEIYIGSWDNNFYTINSDGSLNWSYNTDYAIRSSAAIRADKAICVGSLATTATCSTFLFNLNGSLNWSYATGKQIVSSPVVGDDLSIYVGSLDNNFYSFTSTGSLSWSYQDGDEIDSSPALSSNGKIYVGSWYHNLYSFSSSGKLDWSYETGYGVESSPAIASDGDIYVGSADYNLYAFYSSGSLRWSYGTDSGVVSSPAINNAGGIYVGSYDNNLYSLCSNGSLMWSYAADQFIESSPTLGNDGGIYISIRSFMGLEGGSLYSFKSTGQLNWTYALKLGSDSSAAIGSDGRLYLGADDNFVYCIAQGPTPTPTIAPKEYPQLFLINPKDKYSMGDDIGFEYMIIPGLNPEFNTVDAYVRAEISGGQLYFFNKKGSIKFVPSISFSVPGKTPQFYIYIDEIGFSKITLNYRMIPRATQKPKERADVYILAQSPQNALYWFMQPFSFYKFSSRRAAARNITPADANGKLVKFTPNDLMAGGLYTLAGALVKKGKNPLRSSSWLTQPSLASIGFPIWIGLGGNTDYAMYKLLFITDRLHGVLKLATITASWPAGVYNLAVIFSKQGKDPFNRENQICSESYSFEIVK